MKKLLAFASVSLLLCSCAGTPEPTVPSKCLIQPDRDVKVNMTWEGTNVGFCCNKCKSKFEAMSDEDKREAIAGMNK